MTPVEWEEQRSLLLAGASEELSACMLRVLEDLPPRDLLMLEYRAGGMTFVEMGEELNMGEDAVRKAWGRARRRVRMRFVAESFIEEILGEI